MTPHFARYSRWDGSQDHPELTPEEVIDALSDDLLQHGDLQRAMRNLVQHGFTSRQGRAHRGLQDMRTQVQRRKRDILSQHELDSLYHDLKQRLDAVVQSERATSERKLREAAATQPEAPEALREALRRLAERNLQSLNGLPKDPAGALHGLQQHEFLDPQAGADYQTLLKSLRGNLLEAFYRGMKERLQHLTPPDLERTREMTGELNSLLEQRLKGADGDYEAFRRRQASVLGADAPDSLDGFLQQLNQQMQVAQSLLSSLSEQEREGLLDLLGPQLFEPGLQSELQRLLGNLRALAPFGLEGRVYRFYGDEAVDLDHGFDLIRQLHDLDTLDHQLEQARFSGKTDEVEEGLLEQTLGREAVEDLQGLGNLRQKLEDTGMIERKDGDLRLTGRAARSIGQRALGDIFAGLQLRGRGQHAIQRLGPGGEPSQETKLYEFGDPFHLDLGQTVMNALARTGSGMPLALAPDDFEVRQTERMAGAVTVLLLDVSRSMPMRGNFVAAKKVALALSTLIRTQFPRDTMYLVGFSGIARTIDQEELPYVNVGDFGRGTNMQGALRIARTLLAKHPGVDRQVLVVTDGEPSAYYNALGQVVVEYPPGPQVLFETMREVRQCTKQGIVINTFMLEGSGRLKGFVTELARANRGRVLFTSPDHLGRYVLLDFLSNRPRVAQRH